VQASPDLPPLLSKLAPRLPARCGACAGT
jgi:hypothetical protein